jgi:hypothetical protein
MVNTAFIILTVLFAFVYISQLTVPISDSCEFNISTEKPNNVQSQKKFSSLTQRLRRSCIVRCPVENETHPCYDLNISLDHTVIYSGSVIHHDALPWYSYFNFPWHTMAPLYPSLRSRKIFCRRKRKLRRSKSRIQYYPNSTASFQLLLCDGDIELNPGPDSDSTRSHQKHRSIRTNGTNSNIFSICRDLPSGLKIVHWNLNSIAPPSRKHET